MRKVSERFQHFYGNMEDYAVLALLPSYLEREGSSLIYMVDDLIKKSKNPHSGFYLHELDALKAKLKLLEPKGSKSAFNRSFFCLARPGRKVFLKPEKYHCHGNRRHERPPKRNDKDRTS